MTKLYRKGGPFLSVADALMLMLTFGGFVLTFVGLVIIIIQAIVVNQKDR